VSSYERSLGQGLLADELGCLSYFLIADPEKKGYLNLQEFEFLLKAFRFEIEPFTWPTV